MKNKFGPLILGLTSALLLYGLGADGGNSDESRQESFSARSREPLGYFVLHERVGDVLGAAPQYVRYNLSHRLLETLGVTRFGGKIGETTFFAYPRLDEPKIVYETDEAVALGDTLVEFWEGWDSTANPNTCVVVIAPRFSPGAVEMQILRRFVELGGNVFVSAKTIDSSFLFKHRLISSLKDSFPRDPTLLYPRYSELRLKGRSEKVRVPGASSFFYFEPQFSTARTLGTDERGTPNFVVFHWGKGRLALHSAPHAFANYYLLREDGEKYATAALNVIPPAETVLWDDSHNNVYSDSILRVVLGDARLKTAWYLLIFGAAVYLFFGGRRITRIIPIIERPRNTTVEFVETLGKLYYNRGDHANIARKRIEAFRFFIREHYFLNAAQADDQFFSDLSQKTGVEIAQIRRLFYHIRQIEIREAVSEEELAQLNKLVEAFYSKSRQDSLSV